MPILYAKRGDNGIMYYAREGDFETHENTISVIYNGVVAAGLVYAQKSPTGVLAESYLLKLENHPQDHKVNMFLASSMLKVLYPKYSREFLATWAGKVENDEIFLPAIDDKPDYTFMQTFISAIQKIVIADVVAYTNAKIEATKQIVK